MSRLVRLSIVVVSAGILALMAIGLNHTWNLRADDICQEQSPNAGSNDASRWKWSEFAYVCDYRAPGEEVKRVGVIEAFHRDGRQRHRLDR